MDLGDVNVKEFGKKGDYLIKIEQTTKIIKINYKIKKNISKNLNTELILEELKM